MQSPLFFGLPLAASGPAFQNQNVEYLRDDLGRHVGPKVFSRKGFGLNEQLLGLGHSVSKSFSVAVKAAQGYVNRSAFRVVPTFSFFAQSPSFRRLPTIS